MPATRVPMAMSTPGPVATTVPAKSQPRPVRSGWLISPIPWKNAARDREVDGVDRRGGDLDPDLAGPGLDDGNVDDLDRVGSGRRANDGGAEGGGAHGFAPYGLCSAVLLPHYW